jgi:hypothetical protein
MQNIITLAPKCHRTFFETGFALLEWHTGKWWEIYPALTLDECIKAIRDEPHFMPQVCRPNRPEGLSANVWKFNNTG